MWDVFANQSENFDSFVTPLLSLIKTHIHDNHIEFEVSGHFGGAWPTVCRATILLALLNPPTHTFRKPLTSLHVHTMYMVANVVYQFSICITFSNDYKGRVSALPIKWIIYFQYLVSRYYMENLVYITLSTLHFAPPGGFSYKNYERRHMKHSHQVNYDMQVYLFLLLKNKISQK